MHACHVDKSDICPTPDFRFYFMHVCACHACMQGRSKQTEFMHVSFFFFISLYSLYVAVLWQCNRTPSNLYKILVGINRHRCYNSRRGTLAEDLQTLASSLERWLYLDSSGFSSQICLYTTHSLRNSFIVKRKEVFSGFISASTRMRFTRSVRSGGNSVLQTENPTQEKLSFVGKTGGRVRSNHFPFFVRTKSHRMKDQKVRAAWHCTFFQVTKLLATGEKSRSPRKHGQPRRGKRAARKIFSAGNDVWKNSWSFSKQNLWSLWKEFSTNQLFQNFLQKSILLQTHPYHTHCNKVLLTDTQQAS